MSYIVIKGQLIFCNQIKIIEEIETYNSISLQVTFVDGSTRFIYNKCLKDIKFGSGRCYEIKDKSSCEWYRHYRKIN